MKVYTTILISFRGSTVLSHYSICRKMKKYYNLEFSSVSKYMKVYTTIHISFRGFYTAITLFYMPQDEKVLQFGVFFCVKINEIIHYNTHQF